MNDTVIIDSREKPRAIGKIVKYFDDHGIKHVSSKLICGDYQLLSNGKLAIDRKQSLSECVGNLTQQHTRFRNELMRAQSLGIRLIILVEHSYEYKCVDDVEKWVNPRLAQYCREHGIRMDGDMKVEIQEYCRHGGQKPPPSGEWLAKTMRTVGEKYGVEWEFCSKVNTGKRIIELLTER